MNNLREILDRYIEPDIVLGGSDGGPQNGRLVNRFHADLLALRKDSMRMFYLVAAVGVCLILSGVGIVYIVPQTAVVAVVAASEGVISIGTMSKLLEAWQKKVAVDFLVAASRGASPSELSKLARSAREVVFPSTKP